MFSLPLAMGNLSPCSAITLRYVAPRLAATGHWVPTYFFPRSINLLYTAFFKAWGWRPAVQQIDSRFDGFRFLTWLLLHGSYETSVGVAPSKTLAPTQSVCIRIDREPAEEGHIKWWFLLSSLDHRTNALLLCFL